MPNSVRRSHAVYSPLAQAARLSGTVIVEAIVGIALKQWRYTPVILNGIPTPFT